MMNEVNFCSGISIMVKRNRMENETGQSALISASDKLKNGNLKFV